MVVTHRSYLYKITASLQDLAKHLIQLDYVAIWWYFQLEMFS